MKETMGHRLKAARENLGLKQVEVSVASGVGRTHLSKLEGDKKGASLASFCALADFYKLSLDYLYRGTSAVGPQISGQPPYTEKQIALLELWDIMDEPQQELTFSLLKRAVRRDVA